MDMRTAFVSFKLFAVLLLVLSAASVRGGNSDVLPERREAQNWLKRIQSAAQRLNYSGTFVYQQGSQMRTSHITHLLEGKNEIEKLEILDGKPREYIRNNEEITCYVPESKTIQIERRVIKDVFPAILAASPLELEEYYNIGKGEMGRVAGLECQSVILEPKDNLRYGYKLWAEKATGLLLRAQILNRNAEIVEQIAFTQIYIGDIDRNQVRSSFSNVSGWRVERAVMSPAVLPGWSVKWVPPGFKKALELKRLVSDRVHSSDSAGPQTSGQREVSQIVYSDGLAAISVFIEPGTQSRTEGAMQQGAMNITGKRQGDFWLTIVGEVPATAIRQVANSIEFKPR